MIGSRSLREKMRVKMMTQIDELLQEIQEHRNTKQGIIMFLSGRQIGVSTSIADTITYGYGKLDFNGYWQFPVPEIVVNYVQEMRDEIKQLKMQLEEALDAQ